MPLAQDRPFPRPLPAPGARMTKWQAGAWVHEKLILVEMGNDELVAAFTALAERPPGPADVLKGLFRLCCEIVTSSSPSWELATAVVLDRGLRRT